MYDGNMTSYRSQSEMGSSILYNNLGLRSFLTLSAILQMPSVQTINYHCFFSTHSVKCRTYISSQKCSDLCFSLLHFPNQDPMVELSGAYSHKWHFQNRPTWWCSTVVPNNSNLFCPVDRFKSRHYLNEQIILDCGDRES